ncbi:MAG TPA: alpha/beta hydrolase [Polyangiales bacterium]|nr:alpha/beta hydrolase [Polyangiales bacterium]
MQSVSARNRVNVTGQGTQELLFVHGFGCAQDDWRKVAPRFERDYKVVRYDLTGCGDSDRSAYDLERHHSLQGHATDLLELVHELGLSQPYVVGHSAGAMISALAAIREPRTFGKLALVGASPHYIDEPGYIGGASRAQIEAVVHGLEADYAGWCAQTLPLAMAHPGRPGLDAELLQSYLRADPDIAMHFAHAIFFSDFRSALPFVLAPTLVVQSPGDVFVPFAVGQFLANTIPAAELIQLQTPGHYRSCQDPTSSPRSSIAGPQSSSYAARRSARPRSSCSRPRPRR